MKNLNILDWVAILLSAIGAINWGLIGLFNFNLVSLILGDMSILSRIVYILVGLAGIYLIVIATNLKKEA